MSDISTPPAHPELAEPLGDRYTESAFERSFYRRDLAVVPPFLASLIGDTLPAAVARPRTAEEVSSIVRYAAERAGSPADAARRRHNGVLERRADARRFGARSQRDARSGEPG